MVQVKAKMDIREYNEKLKGTSFPTDNCLKSTLVHLHFPGLSYYTPIIYTPENQHDNGTKTNSLKMYISC